MSLFFEALLNAPKKNLKKLILSPSNMNFGLYLFYASRCRRDDLGKYVATEVCHQPNLEISEVILRLEDHKTFFYPNFVWQFSRSHARKIWQIWKYSLFELIWHDTTLHDQWSEMTWHHLRVRFLNNVALGWFCMLSIEEEWKTERLKRET